MPVTRPNWREGSNCCNVFKYNTLMRGIHQSFLIYYLSWNSTDYEKYKKIRNHCTFSQDLHIYGEDVFEVTPYSSLLGSNNFYFLLRRYHALKNTKLFSIRQLYLWNTDKPHAYIIEIEHLSDIEREDKLKYL